MVKQIIRKVYHKMQQYYPTFRILVWLKEKGITRRINFLISHTKDEELRKHPSASMVKSKEFYKNNSTLQLFIDNRICA